MGNKGAQDAANKATAQQGKLIDRQVQLFDTLFNNAKNLDSSGFWNTDDQVKQLEDEFGRYEKRDAGNTVGALATMGYRPGDTAVNDAVVRTKLLYRPQLDQLKTSLRRQNVFDKIGSYQAANPQSLGQAIDTFGQQAAAARAQMGNPAGSLMSMMPYLMPGKGVSTGGNWGSLTDAVNRGALIPPDANNPFYR